VPRPPARLLVCTLLLVLTTVGWRRGEYFTGSLDPVVMAKALLSLTALALALLMAQRDARYRVGTGSLWALGVLLAGSVMGGLTHGTLLASGVVAVRVAILAATLVLLLRCVSTMQFFTCLAWSCGAIAASAALTGLSTLRSGRLSGGVPQLSPNELALLACIVVLYVGWRVVLDGGSGLLLPLVAVVALGVIWVTGSRTALLMLVAALVVMALHIRRARPGLVAGALTLAAVLVAAASTTGALEGFLERDGTGTSTLDSRYVAWEAAASWADDGWQLVFGGGLSVKIIEVKGQWWDTQPLDSSWVSLLVQTGVLGLLVAGGWAVWTLRSALRAPRPQRALFLGVLLFVLGRSVLESGLYDATPAFLSLLAVSLLAEGGSRRRLVEELLPAALDAGGQPVALPAPGSRVA
jgi:O-antigen ligase